MPFEDDAARPAAREEAPRKAPGRTPGKAARRTPGAEADVSPGGEGVREEVWLLGQPALADYLDFVERRVVGGAVDRRALVDGWRAANDHYHALETREAGIADRAGLLDLPAAMTPLAEALAESAAFGRTFDRVPTRFGMVELDKLVVSQRRVTLPFVEALRARLEPAPDAAELFRFCQPLERRDPPVAIRRLGNGRFAFVSPSNDLRFHEAALLRPDQLAGYETFGPVAGAIGLVVGYGSNFLSVIRSETRMALHNGYHRACALRAAGFTHAPAVIQTVTRRDELDLVAAAAIAEDPAFYFRAKRPPLLKDFFDPRIRRVLPVRPVEKVVEVSFEIRDYDAIEA